MREKEREKKNKIKRTKKERNKLTNEIKKNHRNSKKVN